MNKTQFLNYTTSVDLSLTFETRMCLATPIGLMFIIGTFVKLRMIQYLKQTRTSTSTTVQVDDLVLFEQFVNSINGPIIVIQFVHILFPSYTKEKLGNIIFCSIWAALMSIGIFHRAIGGFGIAAVRLFCIKYHKIVIYTGAKRFVNCICGITFCLSLVFAVGSTVETAILAPDIILSFFKDLKQPAPSEGINFIANAIFVRVVTAFCILFNVLEFLFYVIIFLETYRHHKRHVRLCLSNKPKLANMKKKHNTISAVGQFISWVIEMLICGLLQYILLANKLNFLAWIIFSVLMPSINYLIFPFVQAMSSKELRDHVFNLECWTESCYCAQCITGDTEQDDQSSTSGAIQLQVMQNGHALHV